VRRLTAIYLMSVLTAGCTFDTAGALDSRPDAPDAARPADAAHAIDAARQPDARPPDAARPDAMPLPSYVAYWSFDADASDATGEHDGVLVGAAAITTGNQGFAGSEALLLPSEGSRVDVAAPTSFDFNGDFTWHAYLKTSDGSGAVLSRNPAGSAWNQGSKALFVRNDTVQWDTGWVGNPHTNVVVNDDRWHQVIVTYDSNANLLRILVDASPGSIVGDYEGTHEVDRFDEHLHMHNGGYAETGFSIGQANFTGGLASLDTLVGSIDEVAIFDQVLADGELEWLIRYGPRAF
jgi:hypothetical protein